MKLIATALLLFICSLCFSQKTKGDTLVIEYSPKIKFVKIGDAVYQIESPSLKKVEVKYDISNGIRLDDFPMFDRKFIQGYGDTLKGNVDSFRIFQLKWNPGENVKYITY